jgi:hypothetical protein
MLVIGKDLLKDLNPKTIIEIVNQLNDTAKVFGTECVMINDSIWTKTEMESKDKAMFKIYALGIITGLVIAKRSL